MAFIEIDRLPGYGTETYDKLIDDLYGDGPKLVEGELFRILASTDDGIIALNGWSSREACDRMMARWMEVMQKHGVTMEGASHEEYELHDVQVAATEQIAV